MIYNPPFANLDNQKIFENGTIPTNVIIGRNNFQDSNFSVVQDALYSYIQDLKNGGYKVLRIIKIDIFYNPIDLIYIGYLFYSVET